MRFLFLFRSSGISSCHVSLCFQNSWSNIFISTTHGDYNPKESTIRETSDNISLLLLNCFSFIDNVEKLKPSVLGFQLISRTFRINRNHVLFIWWFYHNWWNIQPLFSQIKSSYFHDGPLYYYIENCKKTILASF